eukprot:11161920-Heterocapsa_arctica.AAC.1
MGAHQTSARGKPLAHLGARSNYNPRCIWACGLLPVPEPGSIPAKPPATDDPYAGDPFMLTHRE